MKHFINFLEYVFNRYKKCYRMEYVSENPHQKGPHRSVTDAGRNQFTLLSFQQLSLSP